MKIKLETLLVVTAFVIDACLLNSLIEGNTTSTNKLASKNANYISIVRNASMSSVANQFGLEDISINIEKLKEEIEKEDTEEKVEEKEEVKQPPKNIVYDGMTLQELSDKLNRSLSDTLSGKGYLIASYSLEIGIDPYMATAIMLHETGCSYGCSYLVNACNNVGGQKGSGCGEYAAFPSLDEGIKNFISNLYNNYVSMGLTTTAQINTKYAEDQLWHTKVDKHIERIKAK